MILSPQIDTTMFIVRTGDTMTGPLVVPGPPTLAGHAANKAYVDTRASVISSDTPPASPIDNTIWFESDTGMLFIRFNDGTSAQWCAVPGVAGDAVRYDAAQTLTTTQQAQARANIGALKKNYIINGGMQVSQENGATAGTTNAYYPVDLFNSSMSHDATVSFAQVASVTPAGSSNRLRATVSVADTNLGTTQWCSLTHKIEGLRCADLGFGTAAAKTLTIQFGVKAPAGTYGVAIWNAAQDRSRCEMFTISAGEANTDVVKSVTFTADTTGTWRTDNLCGIDIRWTLASGQFLGTAGVWGSAPVLTTSAQFNFLGQTAFPFELFDVSLTEGTSAPPFQVPDFASELALCQRYFARVTPLMRTYASAGQLYGWSIKLPVTMRANPTLTLPSTSRTNVNLVTFGPATDTIANISLTATAAGDMYSYGETLTANARL